MEIAISLCNKKVEIEPDPATEVEFESFEDEELTEDDEEGAK